MNYIHRLQREVSGLQEQIELAREAAEHLRDYVSSQKFRCEGPLEGYVNVRDVLARLEPVLRNL